MQPAQRANSSEENFIIRAFVHHTPITSHPECSISRSCIASTTTSTHPHRETKRATVVDSQGVSAYCRFGDKVADMSTSLRRGLLGADAASRASDLGAFWSRGSLTAHCRANIPNERYHDDTSWPLLHSPMQVSLRGIETC